MLLFKHHSMEGEFEKLDSRLQFIAYAIAGFCMTRFQKPSTITDVFRNDPGSTHAYWRGIDLRTRHLTEEEGDEAVEFVNSIALYDPKRPSLMVIKDERKKGDRSRTATGQHWHVQVDPSGRTVLVK